MKVVYCFTYFYSLSVPLMCRRVVISLIRIPTYYTLKTSLKLLNTINNFVNSPLSARKLQVAGFCRILAFARMTEESIHYIKECRRNLIICSICLDLRFLQIKQSTRIRCVGSKIKGKKRRKKRKDINNIGTGSFQRNRFMFAVKYWLLSHALMSVANIMIFIHFWFALYVSEVWTLLNKYWKLSSLLSWCYRKYPSLFTEATFPIDLKQSYEIFFYWP